MGPSWKTRDLGGGGLQSANLRLARSLKRRRVAYTLLALSCLGLHRLYLEDRRGALLWLLGAVATVLAVILIPWPWAWLALVAPGAGLIHDAVWIDRRVTELNKRIRMAAWLGQDARPPDTTRPKTDRGDRFML
jgi:TM2 domain-containing membrane protein YozV